MNSDRFPELGLHRTPPPAENTGDIPADIDLAKTGEKFLQEEDQGVSSSEVKDGTNVPNEARKRVERQFTEKERKVKNFLDNERELVELHPKDSEGSRLFQSKPGRILRPIGVTLEKGGGFAKKSGVALMCGVVTVIPGLLLYLAGEGGKAAGKEITQKATDKKDAAKEKLSERVAQLPPGDRSAALAQKIKDWDFFKTEGNTFQKARFQILEEEIKHSTEIAEEEKITLLTKFTDKKVSSKRYHNLFKKFVETKEVYSGALSKLKELLPDVKEEELKSKIQEIKDKNHLNLAEKKDREVFFEKLIDFVNEQKGKAIDERVTSKSQTTLKSLGTGEPDILDSDTSTTSFLMGLVGIKRQYK